MAELQIDKLPETNAERNEARRWLLNLRLDPGWLFLCKVARENIRGYEMSLLDPLLDRTKPEVREREERLRVMRSDLLKMIEWPEKLIEDLKVTRGKEPSSDPYD